MRIVLISSKLNSSSGGIEVFTKILATELSQSNEIYLVRKLDVFHSDVAFMGFETSDNFSDSGFNLEKLFVLLRSSDVVLFSPISLFYFPFILALKKPFVIIHHNLILVPRKIVDKAKAKLKLYIAKRSNNVFVSHWLKQAMNFEGSVIRNGIDWEPLNQEEKRTRNIDLLFVGRLIEQKGCELLLRAIVQMKDWDDGRNPKLKIIGDGPEKRKLMELAKTLNISEQVEFMGERTRLEVRAFMEDSKIVVVPSLSDEAFGLVAIEALLARAIPIVADSQGIEEACLGKCRTFSRGNHSDLAKVLMDCLGNYQSNYDQIFRNICDWYFSAKRMSEQYQNIIRELSSRMNS